MFIFKPKAFLIGLIFLPLILTGCKTTSSDDEQPETFNSGNIAANGMFSITFDSEGTTEYFCDIHSPDMQGKITVSSTAEAVGSDTVVMENIQFNPINLTVAPNTKVVWVNKDNFDHTVVSGNPPSDNDGDGGY